MRRVLCDVFQSFWRCSWPDSCCTPRCVRNCPGAWKPRRQHRSLTRMCPDCHSRWCRTFWSTRRRWTWARRSASRSTQRATSSCSTIQGRPPQDRCTATRPRSSSSSIGRVSSWRRSVRACTVSDTRTRCASTATTTCGSSTRERTP